MLKFFGTIKNLVSILRVKDRVRVRRFAFAFEMAINYVVVPEVTRYVCYLLVRSLEFLRMVR